MAEVGLTQLIPITGVFIGIFAFIFIALYVYTALALMAIAKKTNTPNAWLAWIPIVNLYLMMEIAGAQWWTLLVVLVGGFLPYYYISSIFITIIVLLWWWGIAKARNKPGWLGLLMIVPVVNLIILAVLAWGD